MNRLDAIMSTEWERCTNCGQFGFIAKINENTLCMDCLNVPFAKCDPGYRKQPIPKEIRAAVLERDSRICKQCGSTINLQADHIHPEKLGGKTIMDNLQTLCKSRNVKKGIRYE